MFEHADGGVIFLDEIGELSLQAQTKLLRFLQDHQVQRVGSLTPRNVDLRVIAATHRNLKNMVQEGLFREDFTIDWRWLKSLCRRWRIAGRTCRSWRNISWDIFHPNTANRSRTDAKSADPPLAYHWPGTSANLRT